MMKSLKMNLAMIALVLGAGSAVATTTATKVHRFSNKTWGKISATSYVDVTGQSGQYTCTGTVNNCTEEYPSDVNPNNQAGDAHPGTVLPTNIVHGTFSN